MIDSPDSARPARRSRGALLVAVLGLFAPLAAAQVSFIPDDGAPSRPRSSGAATIVYGDALAPGWQDWSWGTAVDLANPSPALGPGGRSIEVTFGAAWAGLYLHTDTAHIVEPGDVLRFAVHGGAAGGQPVLITAYDTSFLQGAVVAIAPPTAGAWDVRSVPLAKLGLASIGGIVWQDGSGGAQPSWYLDQVRVTGLVRAQQGPPGVVTKGPALAVDAAAPGTPISEWIYGAHSVEPALAVELGLPVRRFGGNHVTRYNWQLDVSNRASDWFFENVPYPNGAVAQLPTGSTSDLWVEQDLSTGADSVITVPLIGWTPRSRDPAGGFSVSKYGAQQAVDPFAPDFGNGVFPDGTLVTGNDPLDTSVPVGPAFVQAWVQHLVGRFGTAAQGGVRFYALDNEPMLWESTHRDVHPAPTSYDEARDLGVAYAGAIKAVDPTALVMGPEVWGWTAYFWSALDQAAGGAWWLSPVDQLAHGGVPFLEWYLDEMAAAEVAQGQRLLDVLSVHFYPQAPGVYAGATDAATNALRLRATRALWDPAYVDESWIAQPVELVPRLRGLVQDHYPGTMTCVSEYAFGALHHVNGALAQAEVLGLLGREGLDAAMLFDFLEPDEPGAFAFRMYRNYDGMGGRFGGTSLPATSGDPSAVSIHAARRDDGALTVLLVNKTGAPLACDLELTGASPGAVAEHWSYGADDPTAIVRLPDVPRTGSTLRPKLRAASVHLLVLP